ncbi:MAG: CPBP family intramembrane metalloprotease [Deltaproteobacteria bacterium]|nr:CPBP family intramembrane metalloprotease [Deltaproteobacteria bacterium]
MSSFFLRRRPDDGIEGPLEAADLRGRLGGDSSVSIEPQGPFVAARDLCAVGSRTAVRLAESLELPAPAVTGPLRVLVAWVVAVDLLAAVGIGAALWAETQTRASWSGFAVVAALALAASLLAMGHRNALAFAALVSLAVASQGAVAASARGGGSWIWPAAHAAAAVQSALLAVLLWRRRRVLERALGIPRGSRSPAADAPGLAAALVAFGSAYALYACIVFAYHRAVYPRAHAPITLVVWGTGAGAMAVRASLYLLLAIAAMWLLYATGGSRSRVIDGLGLRFSKLASTLLAAAMLFCAVFLGLAAIDSLMTLLASAGPAPEAVASFRQTLGEEASRSSSAAPSPAVLLYAGFLGPVAEELVFRGVLYSALRRRLPNAAAIACSALAFAALHPYQAALFQVAIVGVLFASAYDRTRSLWPSILAHSAWNLVLTLG